MESPPSLEIVYQGINTLYHNPDPAEKEKSSEWLGQLQRSVFAWKVADELLLQNLDLESCYFAAQTMRTKIRYAFHELPLDSHASLRDSLLNHLSKVTSVTPHIILTQLCLALADLVLQMVSWKSPVQDLITRFGGSGDTLIVLLEVLNVLPEEIGSRSLRLGSNRRAVFTESLKEVSPEVVQVMNGCLQGAAGTKDEVAVQIKVFKSLGSWFSVGAIPNDMSQLEGMLNLVFFSLMNPASVSNLHEAATDCICNALVLVEDITKHEMLAQFLFQNVTCLLEAYHLSVAQEEQDRAINFCRIFTELVESLMDCILERPGQGLGSLSSLELVMACVGHHDFEVAEITFNVWYRLSDGLYKVENDLLNQIFQPYIQRLILALTRHCEIEPDHEGIPEEKDDFGEFRTRVTELIKDVVYLVGSDACFRQMYENLSTQKNAATNWPATEAALYVMAAVAKNVVSEVDNVVAQVVHTIFTLPPTTHLAVRYTSIRLIGELGEWIEKHPEYLDPVLNWLLSGLQESVLSSIAANSLQGICDACRKQMASHFEGLLQIIKAMDQFSINNEAAIGLLKGASLILTNMPPETSTQGLRQLYLTQTVALAQILEDGKNTNGQTKIDPTPLLDRIAAIFRHTIPNVPENQLSPSQSVVQDVWPLLSQTCTRYQNDTRIIERCCRCIRFMVRYMGRHSMGLLEPLVTQMVSLYAVHRHSCFLYLGSILVDEYGTEAGCTQGLLDMLTAFCGPTFQFLENANGLKNHPDTVDDLFRLCNRFLQRAPVSFLNSSTLEPILQCALAASMVDHRDANSSVMKFFYDLLKIARTQNNDHFQDKKIHEECRHLVMEIIHKHGSNIVGTILQASLFYLSAYMLPDIADVIYELLKFDQQKTADWLEEALRVLPTHTAGGMISATPEQLAHFHQSVVSANQVKTVTMSLREFTRLFQ